MENYLKIERILKNKNRIECEYESKGKWKELLNLNEKFWIEYDNDIVDVPDSIAVIPLLCNILPISWIFDLEIHVDELDKEFSNCIEKVKEGYSKMYPQIEMRGNIIVKEIKENKYIPEKTGTLFSGGVDAFNTLIKHIDEMPDLLTVWGSDIKLNDNEGWNKVENHHLKVAEQFKLKCSFMKTNFRTFINYSELSNYVSGIINGEWWHEFQHGIGILGLVAPSAYLQKYSIIYIASSYSKDYVGKYTCASDPTIDNYLKFANCKIVHDSYDMNRQQKTENICKYVEQNKLKSLELRVCWQSDGGENCCECEKCYRTIMGIIAEKKDPRSFGFNITKEKIKKMRRGVKRIIKKKYSNRRFRYYDIQLAFKKNYLLEETPTELKWFRNLKINTNTKMEKPNYLIKIETIKIKIKKSIKYILSLMKRGK